MATFGAGRRWTIGRARAALRPGSVFAVTGAAHGIGARTAALVVARGHRAALCDVDTEAADSLAARLGPSAHAVPLDVRDPDAWAKALDAVFARFGGLDVLVQNAGLLHGGRLLEQSPEQLRHMADVNLFGVAHGLRAAVPRLRDQGHGHVVTVASLAAYVPLKGQAFYSATKHAVRALHHAFALEQAGGPVTFTLVCPANVDTALWQQQVVSDANAMSFVKPPLSPERVAEAIWRAAERRPRELLVPFGDGLGAKLMGAFPGLLAFATPRIVRSGLAKLERLRASRS